MVLNGGNSDKVIVTCIKDKKLTLVIIDSNTKGVSINSFKTIDDQSCAEISLIIIDEMVEIGRASCRERV